MLQSIREHTQGWFAGTIISILILSFALWGIHSYLLGAGSDNAVAKVNGVEITKSQLAAEYERMHRQLQMQYGSTELPQHALDNLKQNALQALINLQILKQASLAQNYRINTEQIDNFLQGMPAFQVNGKFSLLRFQQALNATFFSAAEFIDLIRTTLLIDQPRLGIMFTSFALPNEVNDTMALIGQERKIQYAVLTPKNLANQSVVITSKEIQDYYSEHQNDFKTNEQVSIEYIVLSSKDLAAKIHPTDEQLKSFYNENKNAQTQAYEKVKDKIKETYVHQKAEEQFPDIRDKLASSTYEHPDTLQTAAKELGLQVQTSALVSRDQGGKDITSSAKVREAAFSNDVLNLQNNSDVIQLNPYSVAVIRVKSHVPAKVLSLDVVQKQIVNKLKTAATETKLYQLAQDIQQKLQTGSLTPAQIVAQYHLQWTDVGFIGRHAKNIDPAILNNAFEIPIAGKENKINYGTAKMPNGFAIIGLSGVKQGNTTNVPKEQYQAFVDQIQNSNGILEYSLYKDNLIHKSKVVTEN